MAGARYDSYVICTSPRSGSTLLCRLLAATGVAGRPESYFHRTSIADWLSDLELEPDLARPERDILEDVFRAAIDKGRDGTDMFGLRLQRHSFDFFVDKLAALYPGLPNDSSRLHAAFGRTALIHLTRQDKVEQAVSYVKAQQTGLWHRAPDGTELERLSPPQAPAYDAERIRAGAEEMAAYDRAWDAWFAVEGAAPLRLTYDQLSASPVLTLRRVLEYLGLDPAAARGVRPAVAKLADATSAAWVARFRSEQGIA